MHWAVCHEERLLALVQQSMHRIQCAAMQHMATALSMGSPATGTWCPSLLSLLCCLHHVSCSVWSCSSPMLLTCLGQDRCLIWPPALGSLASQP